jgi:bifunctional ADP-heptose synthase (sugar kinase/adenylyltransferase)
LSDRIEFLKNIKNIHNVYSFGTDESLENLMQSLNLDYMVIGSDYKRKKIIGSQYVKEIIFFERIEEYSTTKILNNENISNRRTL